eukprot:CAMPEP_0117650416 /NCGR_PEP_ID=MMETSP0804-20121206/1527_1 /TAXON_ID=1074897 /ORGANISM="Tetraselmis astigmatica, Strain CCMP880" /LENGTH=749 /DNA_ID=CAMNT_0005456285 /DNA_START=180 /DNA_END=2432 /DNA_ORIENTATION=-
MDIHTAALGGEAGRSDRRMLLDIYYDEVQVLDADMATQLQGDAGLTDEQLTDLKAAVETAWEDDTDPILARIIENRDLADVFRQNTSEDHRSGRYNGQSEADRDAAQDCLRRLCQATRGDAVGRPWYAHAVRSVRVEGHIGNIPSPCVLVDVPGLHDPNEERQAAVQAHFASTANSRAWYHWLVMDGKHRNLSDATVVSWMSNLITDGDTCRLRVILSRCDDFREGTAPEGMERHRAEIYEGVKDKLRRRLIENFETTEEAADEAVNKLSGNGAIVFPCSVIGYNHLRIPQEQRTRRIEAWLIYNDFDSEDQTGVPAVVDEIQQRINHAGEFIRPVIDQYLHFVQRMQQSTAGVVGRDTNGLQLVDNFEERLLRQRTQELRRRLSAQSATFRDELTAAESRLRTYCDNHIRTGLDRVRHWGTMRAIMVRDGHFQSGSTTMVGAFPGGSVNINASLCDAYLGSTGGVLGLWVRLFGVDEEARDGLIQQELDTFYADVEQDLANLWQLLPNDTEFEGMEDLANNANLAALIARVVGNNRQGLRLRTLETVRQEMRTVYRQVPSGGTGASQRTIDIVCNTEHIRNVGRQITAMLTAWLMGREDRAEGQAPAANNRHLMTGICGEICDLSLEFIRAQILQPVREALLGTVEDGSREFVLELARLATGGLPEVTVDTLYAAFSLQGAMDNQDGLAICPICYMYAADFSVQNCRCVVPFQMCEGCISHPSVDVAQNGNHAICPHCRETGDVVRTG